MYLKHLKKLVQNQLIGKSLEAHVLIHVDADTKAVIDKILDKPAQWLIVSKVTFTDNELTQYDSCQVQVEKANDMFAHVAGTIQKLNMKMVFVIVVMMF